MLWIWLFVLGGIGVFFRHILSTVFASEFFPIGILLVNVLGATGMGWFYFSPFLNGHPARLAVLIGFFGAFTTFSTFSLDLVNMFERGKPFLALSYFVAMNGLTLLGCWIGMKLAR